MLRIVLLYLQLLVLAICQETQHICNDILHPPKTVNLPSNCTLMCGYQYTTFNGYRKEIPLCNEDSSTPFLCQGDHICRQFYRRSYCKKVKCYCKDGETEYGWYSHNLPEVLSICVVAYGQLSPKHPLVSFPWKIVLMVFGILGGLALIFMILKWFIPIVYSCREQGRNSNFGYSVQSNSLPPAYHNITLSTTDVYAQRDRSEMNADKPPSYEALQIDLPSYEEVEKNTIGGNKK